MEQDIIQTFEMYQTCHFFQTIFDSLENDKYNILIRVLKEFYILDCIRTMSSASVGIKPLKCTTCWKPLLYEIVQTVTKIVNFTFRLTCEGL